MNVIQFGDRACERARQYFDSYIDNELLTETNHEVIRHVASCQECSAILQSRAMLKSRVRQAVLAHRVPSGLEDAVRQDLQQASRGSFRLESWMVAIAAGLALAFIATYLAVRGPQPVETASNAGAGLIEKVSAGVSDLLHIGLLDHVHCTLDLARWKKFLSFESMQAEKGDKALGPEFINLVPLVRERLGNDFNIVQAHRCAAGNRQYVHFILTGGSGEIMSLVITEKRGGESFSKAQAAATLVASGVPIHQESQQDLQVAGFETPHFMAYVISNLDQPRNLEVARAVGPAVYHFLLRLRA